MSDQGLGSGGPFDFYPDDPDLWCPHRGDRIRVIDSDGTMIGEVFVEKRQVVGDDVTVTMTPVDSAAIEAEVILRRET